MDSSFVLKKIRAILLSEWDPVGIAGHPKAQDEYDSYIPAIWTLVIQHAGSASIRDALIEIETTNMGLRPDRERVSKAAAALAALTQ